MTAAIIGWREVGGASFQAFPGSRGASRHAPERGNSIFKIAGA
ncbi:hypothetical protein [Kamptonema formosum]|nr:hypothetical protein [Oscillatoria sp. PCC 10802]